MATKTTFTIDDLDEGILEQTRISCEQLQRAVAMDLKERLASIRQLQAIARDYRKDHHDTGIAGAAVRKYQTAFKPHAAPGDADRARPARSGSELSAAAWDDDAA